MKYTSSILAAIIAIGFAANVHAIDFGQVVSSTISGAQQIAEASKEITPSEEYYIGRAVSAMLLEKYPLLGNSSLDSYVNKVGLAVAYHSDNPVTYGGYHFAVVRSNEVNAFAAPGGFIFITEGLLKQLKNEDELANILGHEIAHVAERHSIRSIKRARWTNFGFYAAGEVGKQYSQTEAGQIADAFNGVVSDVGKQVISNGYSRKDENEADHFGLEYASRAGFSPNAMADFFKEELAKGASTKTGPFSSHPAMDSRLKDIEGDLAKMGQSSNIVQARTTRYNQAVASLK